MYDCNDHRGTYGATLIFGRFNSGRTDQNESVLPCHEKLEWLKETLQGGALRPCEVSAPIGFNYCIIAQNEQRNYSETGEHLRAYDRPKHAGIRPDADIESTGFEGVRVLILIEYALRARRARHQVFLVKKDAPSLCQHETFETARKYVVTQRWSRKEGGRDEEGVCVEDDR